MEFRSDVVFTRRNLLLGAMTSLVAMPALAHNAKTKKKFKLNPIYLPQMVKFSGYPSGTIVIDPEAHFLYLVTSGGRARRYGVGVGKAGLKFKGTARIGRKAEWPSWRPTDNMIRREPKKYARYAGGVPGGPKNPLGARALYLYRGNRDTMYRIHGTTQPWSIGRSVSNGCIRMINDHVMDLYTRVSVGAKVVVL
ncbi:MAG: L,D-transpeptidase [Rhizobiaceae bacterium]|nr:L,D-transpeptidase [Rhizobiaceae bacterium]